MSFSKPLETSIRPLDSGGLLYPEFQDSVYQRAMELGAAHFPYGSLFLVMTEAEYLLFDPNGRPTILTPGIGGPEAGHYDAAPPSNPFGGMSIEVWKWHNARYMAVKTAEAELKKSIIAAIGASNERVIHGNAPTKMLLFDTSQMMIKLRTVYDVPTQARLNEFNRTIAAKFRAGSDMNIFQFVAEHEAAYIARGRMLKDPVDTKSAQYVTLRAAFSNNAKLETSLSDRYDYDHPLLTDRNIDNLTAHVLRHFPALVAQPDPYAAQAAASTDVAASLATAVANATLQATIAAAVAEAMSAHAKPMPPPTQRSPTPQQQSQQARAPTPKASLPTGVCYCYRHGYSLAAGHNGRAGHWGTACVALRDANAPESQKQATAHRVNADGSVSGSWKGFAHC